jgi:putative flippase GtrA
MRTHHAGCRATVTLNYVSDVAEPTTRSPVAAVRTLYSRLRRLYSRFRREIHELGKFGAVGAFAFVIDAIVFNLFRVHYDIGYAWSAIISTTVSATAAFIGNRMWTWRNRSSSSLHREYLLYAFFNAVGLLISLACLWISHDLLGAWHPRIFQSVLADNLSKYGFGLVLGTAFRFWAYRRYVFAAIATPAAADDEVS